MQHNLELYSFDDDDDTFRHMRLIFGCYKCASTWEFPIEIVCERQIRSRNCAFVSPFLVRGLQALTEITYNFNWLLDDVQSNNRTCALPWQFRWWFVFAFIAWLSHFCYRYQNRRWYTKPREVHLLYAFEIAQYGRIVAIEKFECIVGHDERKSQECAKYIVNHSSVCVYSDSNYKIMMHA